MSTSVRGMTTTDERENTTHYVALEGTFGAIYKDGAIEGWFFYPTMECNTEDMTDPDVDHGSGMSGWNSPDETPFWHALREWKGPGCDAFGMMRTEWFEDGPPCRPTRDSTVRLDD